MYCERALSSRASRFLVGLSWQRTASSSSLSPRNRSPLATAPIRITPFTCRNALSISSETFTPSMNALSCTTYVLSYCGFVSDKILLASQHFRSSHCSANSINKFQYKNDKRNFRENAWDDHQNSAVLTGCRLTTPNVSNSENKKLSPNSENFEQFQTGPNKLS